MLATVASIFDLNQQINLFCTYKNLRQSDSSQLQCHGAQGSQSHQLDGQSRGGPTQRSYGVVHSLLSSGGTGGEEYREGREGSPQNGKGRRGSREPPPTNQLATKNPAG